jgi:VWFA-related protein
MPRQLRFFFAFSCVVLSAYCLVPSLPLATAQENSESLYKIEKDRVEKAGRLEDRIYAVRRPNARGEPTLYITVQFKISRADGEPAYDVAPEEIVVKEDGRPVSNVEIHSPRANEPLTTVLAIDMSGSMAEHGKMDEAKQAARQFLDKLAEDAECGLILFDHKLRTQRRPGRQRTGFRTAVEEAQPGGGTAYLDAAAAAISMLRTIKGRKAVLLLTDGVDLNSRKSLKEVVTLAKNARVPVYTVGVGEPGKNTPVNSVLVLDCSGSMRERANNTDRMSKMDALRVAASRFVDTMRPGAQTTLLPFNDEVPTPEPLSADKPELKSRIARLRAGGATHLYDAAFEAVEMLASDRFEGKKAVVVLTDGREEGANGLPGSRHSVEDVIDRAKEAGIPLHMLGLGRPGELDEPVMRQMAEQTGGTYHHARNEQTLFDIFENLSIQLHDEGIDETTLTKLAEETGGKYYPARDISRLRFIYEGLAEELQTTYTVTFPSLRQDDDGTSRDIDISVWQKGVQVSDVLRGGYNVPGVVVPEMDHRVYLALLALLGGLLLAPAVARRFARQQAST